MVMAVGNGPDGGVTINAGRKGLYQNAHGGVILAIGIGLLVIAVVVGFISYQSTREFIKTAEKATATISNIRASGDSHYVTVTFTTSGGATQNASLGYYSSWMKTGDTLEIYYDPANPSSIKSGSTTITLMPALIVGIMGVVFTLVGVFMTKKKREEQRLLREGTRFDAEIMDCRVSVSSSNTTSTRSRAAGPAVRIGGAAAQRQRVNHTFNLIARYTGGGGIVYECKSQGLSYDPRPYISRGKVSIYVDVSNPKKYFMDVAGSMDSNIVQV